MFEDERALLVGMALEADGVLRRGSADLFGACGAVHVVAIAALHEAFIHAMVEGHFELSFLLEMAGVAELGLGLYEQKLRFLRMVRRMAGDATDVILGMDRVDGVHVLRAAGVAGQAPGVDLLRGSGLELENLGFVPATVNVGLAWTVARFATMKSRAVLRIQCGHKMRRIFVALVKTLGWHVRVAGFAGFGAYVE